MNENKITIPKNAMNYGAITGIILFLVFIVGSMTGNPDSMAIKIAGWVVIALGIFVGSKNFRDKQMEGFMTYGQAFHSGFLISFFCSVIVAFTTFLYIKFVDSSMIDLVMEKAEQQMMDSGKSDEQIEQAKHMMQMFSNPTAIAIFTVIGYTVTGAILSLITASFLKKEKPGNGSFDNFIQQNQ